MAWTLPASTLRECPAPMGEGVYHAPGYNEGAENGMSSTSSVEQKVVFWGLLRFYIGEL